MKILLTLVLVSIAMAGICQVEPLKQNISFTLDKKGNSEVEVNMKLNASQWDNFKRMTGNNISVLKRSMENALPSYFLEDFRYEEQPMDRGYSLRFKAIGMAKLKTKERWVLEMKMKNPDINKVSDNIYLLTTSEMQNGILLQQIGKLIFPAEASDIKEETDAFGNAVFTYNLGGFGSGSTPWMLVAGIIFLLASGMVFYMKLKK